ncbi:MAG: UvrB/UvrC motif-containing protein [bacterium]|jgi:protein arginine kinase activator|nr:UvrB/UvrC motif-containing protein [bacterium]
MNCEICKKNVARIHVTQIRDGNKLSIHICPECALEKGVAGPAINTSFSIEQIVNQASKGVTLDSHALMNPKTCTACGLTYNAFKESGRLGCAMCYDLFADELEPLLLRIQKELRYNGKYPEEGNDLLQKKREIAELKRQLKIAVEKEDFHKAAELRDRIVELGKQLLQLEHQSE